MRPKIILISWIMLTCFVFNILFQLQDKAFYVSKNQMNHAPNPYPSSTETISIMLGGLKGILVDILWLKAIDLNQKNKFYELLPVYKAIIALEPNFIMVWRFAAENLVYDVSFEANTQEEKWQWIREGIKLLEEGMRKNPDDYRLSFSLANIYADKCAEHPFYMNELSRERKADNFLLAVQHFEKSALLAKNKVNPYIHAMIKRQSSLAYWLLGAKKSKTNPAEEKTYRLAAVKILKNIQREYPDDENTKRIYDNYYRPYLKEKGWLNEQ